MTHSRTARESADTVHGRLLEAVHISGYTFERACGELEWLLDKGRWQQVGAGFDDVNAFLATIDFSDFKIAIEQRKKLAKRLAEINASQRATGRLLGVDKETVREDLGLRQKRDAGGNPPTPGDYNANIEIGDTASGGNPPLGSWFQVAADPSREAKRITRKAAKPAIRADKLATVAWPTGRYGVILADPPWRPDEGVLDPTRQIENQYPTLSLEGLIALAPSIAAIAADDCVLLLWTTAQKLAEATAVINAWGFTIKSGAVWVKRSIGMGYWFRQRHELLVLATRGTPMTPLEADRPDSVIAADRRGHSEKPDEVYALVERMFPSVPKVEVFARAVRPGWALVTNERELREA